LSALSSFLYSSISFSTSSIFFSTFSYLSPLFFSGARSAGFSVLSLLCSGWLAPAAAVLAVAAPAAAVVLAGASAGAWISWLSVVRETAEAVGALELRRRAMVEMVARLLEFIF
jgi:hypothetical protein